MTSATQAVLNAVKENQEHYIAMIEDLVRASEKGAEPVQALVADWLREMGCEVKVVSAPFATLDEKVKSAEFLNASVTDHVERSNVIARYVGTGKGKSTLLFSHADSPPVHGAENWTSPPFQPARVDGRLVGWGIADDKSGVAAMIAALDALKKSGVEITGDVSMVSCVSKNRTRGMAVALAHGATGDASIYLHPAESGDGLREVKTVTSGNLDFRIKTDGVIPETAEPRHTPFAHTAINACDKAVIVAAAMRKWDIERGSRVKHTAFDSQLGRATNLLLGSISGGEGQKRVPTECTLNYCVTFPDPETADSIRAEIDAVLKAVSKMQEWTGNPPVADYLEGTEPAGIAPDHPLFEAVAEGIKAVTGERPHVYCGHASSDIRIPISYSGIPTVGYGPVSSEIAANGAIDESIGIDEYLNTISATALAVLNWANSAK
ncbi:MAG TPA: M20/M25/M40 family metallo-hydrolase [Devosia sp.]|nr:M20/M25/M40 family metallo-hydrolase [Devosia sp.]